MLLIDHIVMLPTNNIPGEFINGWEKATDKLSHHVHYGQSELCIYLKLDNNCV